MTSRFALAKEHAVRALDELVPELFGSGRRNAVRSPGAWYVQSPGSGSTPDQMVIWRTGNRRGGWRDFVAGVQGDAIDLLAYVHEGAVTAESRIRAVEWLEERFGIRKMPALARAKMEAEGAARRAAAAQQEAVSRRDARERSRKAFYAASPQILGTVIETYLRGRGVALGEVPNLAPSFRFRPDAEYWLGAPRDGDGKRLGPGPKFPALVSAMSAPDGSLCALHYTFIAPDGAGKAPVEKAKLMWPDVGGLAVRVTLGPSGFDCEAAAARGFAGIVGLTEGIEDAMSAALAFEGKLRLHACGSLAGMLSVPDQACASAYLVFRDNDWGKPQAAQLFERAVRRLKRFGKPVEVLAMPADWGKDVNDALNA